MARAGDLTPQETFAVDERIRDAGFFMQEVDRCLDPFVGKATVGESVAITIAAQSRVYSESGWACHFQQGKRRMGSPWQSDPQIRD
jgi:hypothetical protein